MKSLQKNTKKSFTLSILAFSLLIISIIIINLSNKYDLPAYMVGIPFASTCLLGTIGWIFSLRSIKEENTVQKILSLIFNSFLVLMLIAFILGDLSNS